MSLNFASTPVLAKHSKHLSLEVAVNAAQSNSARALRTEQLPPVARLTPESVDKPILVEVVRNFLMTLTVLSVRTAIWFRVTFNILPSFRCQPIAERE
jgi:hypothetical protein